MESPCTKLNTTGINNQQQYQTTTIFSIHASESTSLVERGMYDVALPTYLYLPGICYRSASVERAGRQEAKAVHRVEALQYNDIVVDDKKYLLE